MVQTYVDYMAKVAKLLGTKCDTTKKMREIMDFEIKLANVGTCSFLQHTLPIKQRLRFCEHQVHLCACIERETCRTSV